MTVITMIATDIRIYWILFAQKAPTNTPLKMNINMENIVRVNSNSVRSMLARFNLKTVNETVKDSQIASNFFRAYSNVHDLDISNLGVESLQPDSFIGAKDLVVYEIPANLFDDCEKLEFVVFYEKFRFT